MRPPLGAWIPSRRCRSAGRPVITPSFLADANELRARAGALEARHELRSGPLWIAAATEVPARTVSRILTRHRIPPSAWRDPLTGQLIHDSRATANGCERERPEEMVHIDVKKLGRIPDGGGWRANGRSESVRGRGIGFDSAVIDAPTRLAYAEIHDHEDGVTAARVPRRAAVFFPSCGIPKIERVLSDNALPTENRPHSNKPPPTSAETRFIKPHWPWTNGKAERLNGPGMLLHEPRNDRSGELRPEVPSATPARRCARRRVQCIQRQSSHPLTPRPAPLHMRSPDVLVSKRYGANPPSCPHQTHQ